MRLWPVDRSHVLAREWRGWRLSPGRAREAGATAIIQAFVHLDDVAQPDSTTFGRSVALKGDFAVVLTRSWTDGLYVLGGIYRGTAHGGTSIVYSDDYQEYRVGA